MKTNRLSALKIGTSVVGFLLVSVMAIPLTYASRVVAVGDGGVVLQSADSGGNWFLRSSGTTNDLRSVECIERECWAVGLSGTIIYSQDAGVSWSPQDSGTPQSLFGVDFLDENNGWAVGLSGTVLVTNNGGSIWSPQNLNSNSHFFTVSAFDSNTVWVAGNGGTMRRTIDGGANWSFQTSGTSQTIFGMDFSSSNDGWYGASNTLTGKTTNGGAIWTTQDLTSVVGGGGFIYLIDIQFLDPNLGWLVGESGTIALSTDGGDSWEEAASSDTGEDLRAISMVSEQVGWVVGFSGTIRKTADGGSTWNGQVSGTTENLFGVAAFDVSVAADFNEDGDIDGYDFLTWQLNAGITGGASLAQGDADANGAVDDTDLAIWEAMYGTTTLAETVAIIPEPATLSLSILAVACVYCRRRP